MFNRKIHILVLTSFTGRRPNGMVVCHIDGDKSNNRLDNLRWGTPKENIGDKIKHGTHRSGSKINTAKLTISDVTYIRKNFKKVNATRSNRKELAEKFNVSKKTITDIALGRRFKEELDEIGSEE